MKNDLVKEMLQRREKVGPIGAMDFIINHLNTKKNLHDETPKIESRNTPRLNDIKRFFDPLAHKDILFEAAKINREKGIESAIQYVLEKTSAKVQPEVLLLASCAEPSDAKWIELINKYLSDQDICSLNIQQGDGDRFYRIFSTPKKYIHDTRKISVIMPLYNAEKTIVHAAKSILNQSWVNLELIIVDDCSTDKSAEIIADLAKADKRVIVISNKNNMGPYASKNRALMICSGDYITGHDADDWAHPERLEKQMAYILKTKEPLGVSYMLRMLESGKFSFFGKRNNFSPDGIMRLSSISCIFEKKFLRERLGFWDCVKFGADSEMLARAEIALGHKVLTMPFCSMLCLDLDTSLTNQPNIGIDKVNGISEPRATYKKSWTDWHKKLLQDNCYLKLNGGREQFHAPPEGKLTNEALKEIELF